MAEDPGLINRAAGAGAGAGVDNDSPIGLAADFTLLRNSASSTNTTNSVPRTTQPEVAGQAGPRPLALEQQLDGRRLEREVTQLESRHSLLCVHPTCAQAWSPV